MLYEKKPDLGHLREWGSKVWVHTTAGTKLDGCLKVGRWVGFDEVTNGHHVYWPNKHSISIERSIKFMNGNVILLPMTSAEPIQGESTRDKESKNLQHTLESAESHTPTMLEEENTLQPQDDFMNSQEYLNGTTPLSVTDVSHNEPVTAQSH